MRECFTANGIPNPEYKIVSCKEDLEEVNIPYPCIVKPVDSGGSQGVTKVNNFNELKNAFDRAIEYSRKGGVIIEQYIDGREFSVEYISHNGKHYHLQITDKTTSGEPYFVELAHHQPAQISMDMANRIKCMVEKALTALSIENSASHTEIKLNSKGELYIIEIGARMGGDYITSDLVRLSTGYDMVKGCIELATGDFRIPEINDKYFSGIYFYSKLTPYIADIINNSKMYPDIVASELESTQLPDTKSNADRRGYFIYRSINGKMEF